jgi:hypothetical protein
VSFTFSTPASLSSGTTYYWRIQRTGARDTSNNYNVGVATNLITGGKYIRDNNVWSAESATEDFSFRTFASGDVIAKLEPQYLLANTAETTTGLKDDDTLFDPAEWSGVTNVYLHEQNASLNTSNTKLQTDPNGTPADITNSSITGGSATAADSRKRGSAMTMPGTAQTIDVNVVSA